VTEAYPDDLLYHPEHAWARLEGTDAVLGITWHAQDSLGELIYVDAPRVGMRITADAPYASAESAKANADVFAPLSGEVVAVNELLKRTPERVNDDPYGDGWLVRVRLEKPAEAERLLGAAAYRELIGGET
jgi:glycine cleavage system H protein